MSQKNDTLLRRGIQQLGISGLDEAVPELVIYLQELKKWSQRINLISREGSDEQIVAHHFLDSLSLLCLDDLRSSASHLLDVGTGAGFPGLVLAIACPQARFTLLEPRQKRLIFLRHIVRTLGLENVQVHGQRLEHMPDGELAHCTHVSSRAVAAPLVFLDMAKPVIRSGARAMLMMAREERLQEVTAPGQWFAVVRVCRLHLPFSGAQRILALAEGAPS